MDTPIPPPSANALPAKSATAAQDGQASGLSSEEARRQLQKIGPNAMPDTALHPLRRALGKFWAPVPWMLEAAIVLELVLGKYIEAAVIAALLVFNAALGLFQESRAQATLAALKSRLALNASDRRDGAGKTVPAGELVPGDLVKVPVFAFFGIAQSPVTRVTPRKAKTKKIPANESRQSPRTVEQQ
jgi:H+-transporting ATPase